MYLIISTEQNSHFSVGAGASKLKELVVVNEPYQQSEKLLSEIMRLLVKVKVKKVTGIMVVSGPGGFSALRIGIATANALAFAWGIKVVGIKLNNKFSQLSEEKKMVKLFSAGVKQIKLVKKGKWVMPEYDGEPNIGKVGK
jgi:tRNA A37 threonylcarbamoyladenosine modification protein TsaB